MGSKKHDGYPPSRPALIVGADGILSDDPLPELRALESCCRPGEHRLRLGSDLHCDAPTGYNPPYDQDVGFIRCAIPDDLLHQVQSAGKHVALA
jgi:hypothetical protein